MRLLLLLSLLGAAPAGSASPKAVDDATLRSLAKGVRYLREERASRVVEIKRSGVDEARVLRRLEVLVAACLAAEECTHVDDEAADLLGLIEEIGTERSFPLLTRLEAHGVSSGTYAREVVLERLMVLATAKTPCAPPSAERVAAERARLADFPAVALRDGAYHARQPTPAEMDDLAYLYASIGAGNDLPKAEPREFRPFARRGAERTPENLERDRLFEQLRAGRAAGDIEKVAASARAYLASLGYPGEIRVHEDDAGQFHGPRADLVIRHLRLAAEQLGQLDEALRLHSWHVHHGGCGNHGVAMSTEAQQGRIRLEERLHGCAAIVADRLQAPPSGGLRRPTPYGTERLTAAGFDVLRLYRGALVTLFRGAVSPEVFASLPDEGPGAQARWKAKGVEDWASRLNAVEGYADEGQRAALPKLLELVASGSGEALRTLGKLAGREPEDPCLGREPVYYPERYRLVRPLGMKCATQLTPDEAAALARKLLPLAQSGEPNDRSTAIEVIGEIGSPAVTAELKALLDDPAQGREHCALDPETGSYTRCTRYYVVRSAAAAALEQIERREASWEKQRAEKKLSPR